MKTTTTFEDLTATLGGLGRNRSSAETQSAMSQILTEMEHEGSHTDSGLARIKRTTPTATTSLARMKQSVGPPTVSPLAKVDLDTSCSIKDPVGTSLMPARAMQKRKLEQVSGPVSASLSSVKRPVDPPVFPRRIKKESDIPPDLRRESVIIPLRNKSDIPPDLRRESLIIPPRNKSGIPPDLRRESLIIPPRNKSDTPPGLRSETLFIPPRNKKGSGILPALSTETPIIPPRNKKGSDILPALSTETPIIPPRIKKESDIPPALRTKSLLIPPRIKKELGIPLGLRTDPSSIPPRIKQVTESDIRSSQIPDIKRGTGEKSVEDMDLPSVVQDIIAYDREPLPYPDDCLPDSPLQQHFIHRRERGWASNINVRDFHVEDVEMDDIECHVNEAPPITFVCDFSLFICG